ncbi:hypothetical protein [Jannaschia ovalis]|uniref:Uncharacterized protein n=1 Tax=Jannaschia ovalis TaxID=3038773 RepID=A0ABY8LAU8_9RHOB|nr:hypothetical protein [Jannaschia sp. GRR-S6-38]WGH78409.1 hypothetical protein P8627_15510 [Jannaschia sp. GRR-S6-38]
MPPSLRRLAALALTLGLAAPALAQEYVPPGPNDGAAAAQPATGDAPEIATADPVSDPPEPDAASGGPDATTPGNGPGDAPVFVTETRTGDPFGLLPDMGAEFAPSAETRAAIDRYILEQYRGAILEQRHRNAVFTWHRASSQIIFVMVLVVVAAGLGFSWLQFKRGAEDGAAPETTSFEASQSGLKLSSPVLGVIILAMSLVFFYLYLVHVYPVRVLN